MSVAIVCPSCGKTGRARDEDVGHPVKCPRCGQRFAVTRSILHAAGSAAATRAPVAQHSAAIQATAAPAPAALDFGDDAPRRKPAGRSQLATTLWVVVLALVASGAGAAVALWKVRAARRPAAVVPADVARPAPVPVAPASRIPAAPADRFDQGLIDVVVDSCWIDTTRYCNAAGEHVTSDRHLHVRLYIGNRHPNRKLDYTGWGTDRVGVSLADEHGNRYGMVNFGHSRPGWFDSNGQIRTQAGEDSVHPGTTFPDLLVFELPVAQAKTLHLRLPRRHIGGSGDVTLSILTSSIRQPK